MITTTKDRWSFAAGAVLMVVLILVLYWPTMSGGFVWDDQELILKNSLVKAGDGLYRFWFTTEAPDYYPLTWSLWWFEWRLWGTDATGYHVVNMLLHAINTVLVWQILRRLKVPGAWLAGLVFAVHPVNVATVAWISEQKNTLSMLFYALAILLYLRFDEEGLWRWYGVSVAAFLLALFSKTAVVMLPFVLLGCVWWRRGRVCWKDFLHSVPFFVFSLVLGLVTVWFQYHNILRGHTVRTGDFAARLVAAGYAPWFYLYKALLPVGLTAVYPKWAINTSDWTSYVPGLALVGAFLIFWWKRETWGRPLVFGLGYFVVMLFPVLGFVDQAFYRFSLVADHWQYYPIVGVIALAVATGEKVCHQMSVHHRYRGALAGAAVLMMLGGATWRRGYAYQTDQTLWLDAVAKNSRAVMAHYNLANSLWQAGRFDEAVEHYKQALKIEPDFVEAHNNLGNCLFQTGRLEEAIAHYERVLQIEPGSLGTRTNLGSALLRAGRVQEAIGHFEQVLWIKPDYAEAHYNLGVALERAGRVQEAIGHFEQALQVRPNYAEARNKLTRLQAPP